MLFRSSCGVSFGWILAGEDFGEVSADNAKPFLSIKNARRGPRGVMILLSHHNIGLGGVTG